jgi:aldehyde dehydrogenase (NAD+)
MAETKFTKQFIGGEWVAGSSQHLMANRDPYTNEVLFEFQAASEQDVDQAYQAALSAQKAWANTPPAQKQAVLLKLVDVMQERKDEIIDWLIKEGGSTLIKADIEWQATVRTVKEAATFPYRVEGKILPSDVPGKENRVYRSPKGVVGVIGPWNFPLVLAMRSVAPAIATGNTVVLKAASDTPVTGGLLIADLFDQAGLPKGVLNAVAGRGSEIGDAFVIHPIPRLISFTGSTEVGRRIAELAGKHLKEVVLELGGNNVQIVLEDANLEKAAEAAAIGKFMHQGQICMALNRIIVVESVYDQFVALFNEKVKRLKAGNPQDPATIIGPLINHDQVERIRNCINESIKLGAKVMVEGKVEGNVMSPVIVIEVSNDMPLAQTEIFGPVAPIIKVKDEEEAIAVANDSPYGLSGSVFSGSLERGVKVAKQIETGMIHVNDISVNEEAHVSFGGEKNSGIGRFGGEWAIDKFTTVKWISVQEEYKYFPFFD